MVHIAYCTKFDILKTYYSDDIAFWQLCDSTNLQTYKPNTNWLISSWNILRKLHIIYNFIKAEAPNGIQWVSICGLRIPVLLILKSVIIPRPKTHFFYNINNATWRLVHARIFFVQKIIFLHYNCIKIVQHRRFLPIHCIFRLHFSALSFFHD